MYMYVVASLYARRMVVATVGAMHEAPEDGQCSRVAYPSVFVLFRVRLG